MFSQFRSAVEQLAQAAAAELPSDNAPRSSIDATHTRSTSGSPLSSGQLAENALSTLRKSLAPQRRGSSDAVRTPTSASSPPAPTPAPAVRKSNLEERLRRATAGISEPVGATATKTTATKPSPTTSTRVASPSPMSRGRTPEASGVTNARNAGSRAASPSPMTRGRTMETTASAATKTTTSRPPSRVSSPAPMAKTRTASISGSAAASNKPSSRPSSPSPLVRTRTSELSGAANGNRTTRAASPSPMGKNRTPLRRDSAASTAPSKATPPVAKAVSRDPLLGQAMDNAPEETSSTPQKPAEEEAVEESVQEVPTEEDGEKAVEEEAATGISTPETEESDDDDDEDEEPTASTEKAEPEPTLAAEPQVTEKPSDATAPPPVEVPETEVESSPESVDSPPTETVPDANSPAEPSLVAASVDEPVENAEPPPPSAADLPELPTAPSERTETPSPSTPVPVEPEVAVITASATTEVTVPSAEPVVAVSESTIVSPEAPAVPSEQPTVVEQPAPPPLPVASTPVVDHSAEVESLQARLKQVEQRFSDVSTSFKRLQAEKLAADAVLRDNSPLEGISDANGLRDFFSNLKAKDQVFQDEIKRLNQKLEVQEDRLEEIRDAHKLESNSRSDEVQKLKKQLDETEALFQAAQRATSNAEDTSDKHKNEIAKLEKEVEQSKGLAKEEEEKRVKAISLLKTVRQKLVKAEKDKEDAMKEFAAIREREKGDRDKEQAEKINFQHEMEAVNAVHDKAITNLKAQFDKDFASMRERYEQEIIALKGQHDLESAAAKSAYTKELSAKSSQISTLENSLNNVTRDKNAFFDQLQLRQAEVESSQAHLESLQHQNTEFQFQLREANDRLALLKEEYAELLRESESRSREPTTSPDEIARMVSAAEAKYESRISEMKRNISVLEKERSESEADWSRKLKEKVKELDDIKRILGSAARTRENEENMVANLKEELAKAQEANKALQRETAELPILREQLLELENSSHEQEEEINMKIHVLEKQIEEHKTREGQLKQSNKTLKDELRKVQSSAALLERQRNPGVGYWTTRPEGNGSATPTDSRASFSSPSDTPRTSSPAPSVAKAEEEVNLEYLRNVILQFLEHKEMRPNLVKVMSIILHFTPQETRRLIAKV